MAFKRESFWINDEESKIADADKFWDIAEKVMNQSYPTNIPQTPPTSTVERALIPACQARKEATDTMYRNIVSEINKAISEGETYCIYKTGSDVPEWIRKELSELGYEVVLTMKQKVIIKW